MLKCQLEALINEVCAILGLYFILYYMSLFISVTSVSQRQVLDENKGFFIFFDTDVQYL